MSQSALERECRLAAIEYLLCNLYARIRSMARESVKAEADQELAVHLQNYSLPGLDPVLSDHAAAEFETAVRRLQAMIAEMEKG